MILESVHLTGRNPRINANSCFTTSWFGSACPWIWMRVLLLACLIIKICWELITSLSIQGEIWQPQAVIGRSKSEWNVHWEAIKLFRQPQYQRDWTTDSSDRPASFWIIAYHWSVSLAHCIDANCSWTRDQQNASCSRVSACVGGSPKKSVTRTTQIARVRADCSCLIRFNPSSVLRTNSRRKPTMKWHLHSAWRMDWSLVRTKGQFKVDQKNGLG